MDLKILIPIVAIVALLFTLIKRGTFKIIDKKIPREQKFIGALLLVIAILMIIEASRQFLDKGPQAFVDLGNTILNSHR